jgi:hypothetical protein
MISRQFIALLGGHDLVDDQADDCFERAADHSSSVAGNKWQPIAGLGCVML